MALGLTQPLTERVPGAFPWRLRRPMLRADNLTTFMSRLSRNLLASTTWNPQSLYRTLMGIKNVKAKCTPVQTLRLCRGRTSNRGSRGIALLFLYHGIRRGYWSASGPGRSLPPGKTRCPLYRMLGGPQAWTGAENLVPTGIRSRTVQTVANCYTDYATRPILMGLLYLYLTPLPSVICSGRYCANHTDGGLSGLQQ